MDLELLADVFGYLPEKYFATRMLIKNFQTRVSFVDYERVHYYCHKPRPGEATWFFQCNGWELTRQNRTIVVLHQEYGPAVNQGHVKIWANKKCGRHRSHGPALFYPYPESQFVESVADRGLRRICYASLCISLPAEKISDSESREITEVWYEYGIPKKLRTKSDKIIEIPPRTP